MNYRELAAKQRGFLLRSQLTEEEIQEARETGFIIENPPSRLDYLFYTKLNISDWSEMFYKWWLVAFPTIPPEQRNPMPYLAGSEALQIRGLAGSVVATQPVLSPHQSSCPTPTPKKKSPTNSLLTTTSNPRIGLWLITPP